MDEFYNVVRSSYSVEEWAAMQKRAMRSIFNCKVRGVLPWAYEGEREDMLETLDSFDWPEPPAWERAA